MTVPTDDLMLVLPLPIFRCGGELFLDTQAQNGLRLWLDNFSRLTLCLPSIRVDSPPAGTSPFRADDFAGRCMLVELPNTRRAMPFFAAYRPTVARLRSLIARHRYLHFAIGGLWGDWAAIAAFQAKALGRPFSVWTDRVESQVTAYSASQATGLRRLWRGMTARMMGVFERAAIRRASLGLFHGGDCFAAYGTLVPTSRLVHDIHVDESRRIPSDALATKKAAMSPLRIVYVGRIHPDKGALEWIDALAGLRDRDVPFEARWYGSGPLLEEARQRVEQHDLASSVAFPGNVEDRDRLFALLSDAHIFMFCHRTPESPRCLIEALICGTPIVGFGSAYSRDLVSAHGGGRFVPMDADALAETVAGLARDPDGLSALIDAAAQDGRHYVDHEVFKHRSDLMKAYS